MPGIIARSSRAVSLLWLQINSAVATSLPTMEQHIPQATLQWVVSANPLSSVCMPLQSNQNICKIDSFLDVNMLVVVVWETRRSL
ncbi:hypothetical protein BDP27DRAFT_1311453 [Rhodocollybia butyracea]|uniref:Secreted protein n=1 Tax=Rhodocollybia butyracea TaxID=206335 RepID=A0A9P5UFV8_9AGAR|nr:hypothetical protein BDP27DRAFT_1311453 [Rhodocollybia butyracea]